MKRRASPKITIDPQLSRVRFPKGSCTSHCKGSCCKESVLVDAQERARIEEAAPRLQPYLAPGQPRDPASWFERRAYRDPDFPSGEAFSTARGPHGCVFLDKSGRCSLHRFDAAQGEHHEPLKPFFCRLYPLTIERGVLCFDHRARLKTPGCCVPSPQGERTIEQTCRSEIELAQRKIQEEV